MNSSPTEERRCSFCGHLNRISSPPKERIQCEVCKESLIETEDLDVQIFSDERHCNHCQGILDLRAIICNECNVRYCRFCLEYIGHSEQTHCERCRDRVTRERERWKQDHRVSTLKTIGFWIAFVLIVLIAWSFLDL